MKYGYTQLNSGRLESQTFAFWCWMNLAIAFIVAASVVRYTTDAPIFWLGTYLIIGVVALPLAYYIAKINDAVATSCLAVLIGAGSYGLLGGVANTITTTLDMERVFDVCVVFSGLCVVIESIRPGIIAQKPIWALAPILSAPIGYWLIVSRIEFDLWDPVLYIFIVISAILEYARAWQSEHTSDNAIDFSVEFIVYPMSFFAGKKRGSA